MKNKLFIVMLAVLSLLFFSIASAEVVYFFHTAPAGTTTAITDSSGALVWRAEYLPFGKEQLLVNNKVNDKMFEGKYKI